MQPNSWLTLHRPSTEALKGMSPRMYTRVILIVNVMPPSSQVTSPPPRMMLLSSSKNSWPSFFRYFLLSGPSYIRPVCTLLAL